MKREARTPNESNEGKIGEGSKMEADKCIRRQGIAYLTANERQWTLIPEVLDPGSALP